MPRTRVKEKFQVTIPVAIRKQLGIKVGDEFEATTKGDNIILLQPQAMVDKSKADAIERFFTVLEETGERNKDFSDEEVIKDVLETIQEVRQEKYASRRR